jgi:hypothetical protein
MERVRFSGELLISSQLRQPLDLALARLSEYRATKLPFDCSGTLLPTSLAVQRAFTEGERALLVYIKNAGKLVPMKMMIDRESHL